MLPGTWVLKRKRDENGRVTKYKARLCVRGDRQVPDVDFSETFAPTATATTVRILFALLVQLSLTIATAHLSEDIYMKPPPYFMHQIPANFVLKLLMSLYGLRQSANLFYKLLAQCLDIILAATHVDDIFCATNNTSKLNDILFEIGQRMEITVNWNPTHFIGMRVTRTTNGICLDQVDYIDKILESFHMNDCNSKLVPMQSWLSDRNAPACDLTLYRQMIGSLIHLRFTRPDLQFSLSYLARFMSNPNTEHLAAVKQLFRYLATTRDLSLCYSRSQSPMQLVGYVDATWASEKKSAKSTSGHIFYF